jgi:TolB-like protein/Tfp pilus assembly protein PilF
MSEPNTAVFLSYASQDAVTARRICDVLRAAGIEVWFDQSELRGGDAWDQQIRRQIRECALFIPIISAHTQARLEGYFRREWRLAVDRTHDMADGKPFLVPVVIDDTEDKAAHVPEAFHAVQWTRLPAGEASTVFAQRVSRLLERGALVSAASSHVGREYEQAVAGSRPFHRSRLALLIGVAGVIAVGYFAFDRFTSSQRVAEATAPAVLGTLDDAAPSASSVPRAPSALPAETNSVAVLPFADLSPGKDQEYLSDGLAEEIMSALARVGGLRVAARTSAFSFKGKAVPVDEIGARLRVAHIIEGSVRQAEDRLRITVQLIDVSNGFEVWSTSYDRELSDIFAVQEEISRSIIEHLHVRLTGEEQNTLARPDDANQEAYDLYLRGRHAWAPRSPAGLQRAVEYFERAIKIDPTFARAYVGLADALIVLPLYTDARPADVQPRAKAAALKSVSLNPTSAEAQASLGYILMSAERDWAGAGRALQGALRLNPNYATANHWYGDYLAAQGRVDESVAYYERAARLDPLSATVGFSLGWLYMAQRRFDAAVTQLEKASELDPSLIDARLHLARTRLFQGQQAAAIAELENIVGLSGRRAMHLAFLGHAYADTGRRAEALRIIEELNVRRREIYVSPLSFAIIYIGLGQSDDAFHWLELAREAADPWLTENNFDLIFDPVRGDARWRKLRREMGFAE